MDYLWLYETATLRLMMADAAKVAECRTNDADARFIARDTWLAIHAELVRRGEAVDDNAR